MSQLVKVNITVGTGYPLTEVALNGGQFQRVYTDNGTTKVRYNQNYRYSMPVTLEVSQTASQVEALRGASYAPGVNFDLTVLAAPGSSLTRTVNVSCDDIVYAYVTGGVVVINANLSATNYAPDVYTTNLTSLDELIALSDPDTLPGEEIVVYVSPTGPLDGAETEQLFTNGVDGEIALTGSQTDQVRIYKCYESAVCVDAEASTLIYGDTWQGESRLTLKCKAGVWTKYADTPITPTANDYNANMGATDFTYTFVANVLTVTFVAPTEANESLFDCQVTLVEENRLLFAYPGGSSSSQ